METFFPQNLTIKDAAEFQAKLASQLILEDAFNNEIKTVGGAIMHTRGDFITISCATFKTDTDLKKFELLDKNVVREKAPFAALPGLESFRDGAILAKILRTFTRPDLFFIEGHGINHPHKLGLVSHVGFALDMPTIAVSRDLIAGKVQTIDGKDVIVEDGAIIGGVLKTKLKLFVAPGHRISWQTALELAKKCAKSSYPEPLKIVQENLVAEISSILKNSGQK